MSYCRKGNTDRARVAPLHARHIVFVSSKEVLIEFMSLATVQRIEPIDAVIDPTINVMRTYSNAHLTCDLT